MDWRAGLAVLDTLAPSTIKMGLARMERALAELGHPERDVPALHVAGTNGKGSTCAFADSMLRAEGYRVGFFSSPHLVRVNERFRVGGKEISDPQLGTRLAEILERYPDARTELTYFEMGTLVAFWHFARERLDLAVLETGLGGRLDATVTCVPKVTAITALGMDHMEFLGDTLPRIAAEKAGIFKAGVPAVTAPQPPEAMAVLEARAAQVGMALHRAQPLERAADGSVSYRGLGVQLADLQLGLRGEHQRANAAVALASVELLGRAGFPVSSESMRRGLASARWPGRLEELASHPTLLVDGAHNPQGVDALVTALDALYPGKKLRLVFGVLADKPYGPMMERLFVRAEAVYLTSLPSPRSLAPSAYLEEARSHCPRVSTFEQVSDALAAARAEASPDELIVAAGSLILVGEVKKAVG